MTNGQSEHPNLASVVEELTALPESPFYWQQYKSLSLQHPEKFAALKVSGECIENSLGELGSNIGLLYAFGLYPVIVHGYGKALTNVLKAQGITTTADQDGDRITDDAVMEYVLSISHDFGEKLAGAVESHGARAALIPFDKVFQVVPKSSIGKATGSRNGEIVAVHLDAIVEAIHQSKIPILSPVGADETGKPYNVNADTASSMLVSALQPHKYVMLTGTNGVLDNKGQTINEVTLRNDYENLISQGIVTGGMKKKLDEVYQLLKSLGEEHSVQITTPSNLLKELFSKKGAGTYIQLGYVLAKAKLSDLDPADVQKLMLASFGQQLAPSYFSNGDDKHLVVEQHLKGAVVFLTNLDQEIGPHMDILAVQQESQGNGLGKSLMMDGMNMYGLDRLLWRSQPHRGINSWYFMESDGHQKAQAVDGLWYNIFWKGQGIIRFVPAMVGYIQDKPSNFVKSI